MQTVWNTLKWRSSISHYTKLIGNIIIIALYTFSLNSVFTTDSLVRYCLFDMQKEWTWCDMCIWHVYKTKIHPNIFRYTSIYILSRRIKKKEEVNISTMKTHQMSNKWQCLICIKVSFLRPKLAKWYSDTHAVICQWKLYNYKTHLDYFCL